DEQRRGHRDLRDDERGQRPRSRASARALVALLEDRHHAVAPGDVERGEQTEDAARQERHSQRKEQHSSVEAEVRQVVREAGRLDRIERDERRQEPEREKNAERSSGEREKRAFGEKLRNEARSRRTQRAPDRHLAL